MWRAVLKAGLLLMLASGAAALMLDTTTVSARPTTVRALSPSTALSGIRYTPSTPGRILDTRPGETTIDGVAQGGGVVGQGETLNLVVTGRAGVPATGVSAVVLNVTAVDQTRQSFLTVFPAGAPRPLASNLNPNPGIIEPNLVIAKVGAGGEISIYNNTGSVNLVADVEGWFPLPLGPAYAPLAPARILDTRPGNVTVDGVAAGGGNLTAGSTIDLTVTGRGGVPSTGVGAVVLNVTAVDQTARSFVTVFPTGSPRPNSSDLNPNPGVTAPNLVIAMVGAGGQVSIYNNAGEVNLVADVQGWFPSGPAYTSLTPARLLETRAGFTTIDGVSAGGGPVGPNSMINVKVTDRAGVPASGVGAVALNVTATDQTNDTYLTVFPAGSPRPIASNLNPVPGLVAPNMVIAKVGANGEVSIYNRSGTVNVIADVHGWFPSDIVTGDDAAMVLEDSAATPIDVLANDTVTDGGPKTIASASSPAHGFVALTGGSPGARTGLTYTPDANYCNTPPGTTLDTFTYTLNGGATANVSVTVTCVNDAPGFTAGADSTVLEDAGPQTVNGWASAISAGPANEAAQTLTFTATNDNNALFSAPPAVNAVTGNLTYTPASNANGSAVVSVHISDNGGTANGGVDTSPPQMFTITVTAVNDPPAVPNPTFAAQANMKVSIAAAGLLAGATDPDSGDGGYTFTPVVDAASVTATTPAGGTISNVNVNTGSFDFDPPPGVTGAVTFQYRICDNGNPLPRQCSALATATVNVSGPVIWFVNPAVAGPGDGRLSNPFKFLSGNAGPANDADDVDAANQNIFVYSGTVTSGITLNAFESLIGQGVSGASFDALYGITPPAGTIARPTIATGGTTVQGTVALATNSTVRALAITPTGANQGLTGAGGLTGVTVSETSVTTTTGTAVSLSNVAGTISLRSVSSNGAPNGINLTATQGSFTVTGTGTAGSGGTIQASTDSGIQANGAANLNLSWMTIQNNGNALNEGGIRLVNVTGSGQLTSSTVTGSFEDNVYLSNTGGVPLTAFNIQGPNCSIGNNNTTFGNTGVFVLAKNTATMSVTVDNCAFSGNRTDTIHTDAADSSNLTSTITNNTITAGTGGANQGNIGINVTAALTSTLTYDVENNKIGTNGGTNSPLLNHGVNVFAGNSATVSGKVIANTIVLAGAGMSGTGIRVFQSDSGSLSAKVVNNTVSNVGLDYGIDATDNGTLNVATTGKLNIGVVNNNVSVLSTAINAIHVRGRRDTTTCASITGNTATTNGGGNALHVSQANTATYNLEVPSPLGSMTAAQAQTAETSLNPAAVGVEAFSATGFTGVAVGGCTGIPS